MEGESESESERELEEEELSEHEPDEHSALELQEQLLASLQRLSNQTPVSLDEYGKEEVEIRHSSEVRTELKEPKTNVEQVPLSGSDSSDGSASPPSPQSTTGKKPIRKTEPSIPLPPVGDFLLSHLLQTCFIDAARRKIDAVVCCSSFVGGHRFLC